MYRKAILAVVGGMLVVLVVVGIIFIVGLQKQNSQEAWRAVLKKCADTNLLGADVVYFGASNQIGPGSVWRKASDGSYRLFYELSDLETDPEKRKLLVVMSNQVGCQGSSLTNWALDLGLPFEGRTTPLAVDVAADLKRARSVSVSVTGYALDELKEGAFEEVIRKNVRLGGSPESFIVAANAIRVTGFESEFDFSDEAATEMRAKYKDKFISLKDGATLKSNWSSETKLKLSTAEPFYILAGFSRMTLTKHGLGVYMAKLEPVNGKSIPFLGNDRPDVTDSDVVASLSMRSGRLPQTASPLPLVALLGVAAIAFGVIARQSVQTPRRQSSPWV